jgi:hypothetical protein
MASKEPLQTLEWLETIRGRTRQAVMWGWLPFLVFGIATLVSVPLTPIDSYAIVVYWLIAGPLALAVTLLGYRRMELRRGLMERNERLYAVLIASMLVAALAIGFFADDDLASQVGPVFPIGVGLLVIAAIDRSAYVAAVGALIVGLGVALLLIAPAHADTWAAVGEGIILVGASFPARRA